MNVPLLSSNDGDERSDRRIIALLFLGIVGCYAMSWVWSARILETASPLWSVAIRLAASWAAVVVINALRRGWAPRTRVPGLAIGPTAVLSLLGFAGFFGLTYLALAEIPASLLVLVLSTIPVLTLLQGVLLFGMRAGPMALSGIGCIMAAVALFARQLDPVAIGNPLPGILCGLAAAVGYSFYGLLYKKWAAGLDIMALLPCLLLPSALGIAALALAVEGKPALERVDVAALALIGAVIAAPVYVMYNALILRAGPLVAGAISVAAPITTFILENLMSGGQRLDPGAFALVVLGAAGVALLMHANQNRKDPR